MRKVTKMMLMLTVFVLTAFAFATQGNAQVTLLTESWENGGTIPAGWATEQVSGTSGTITFVTTSSHPTGITAYDGSYFAKFNSWTASTGNSTRLKRTTAISTVGYSNVAMNFAWYQEPGYSNNDHVDIQWSTDGTTWTTAGTFSRYSATAGWTIQNVTFPAGANGQATFYVAYTFVSAYGNDCHLDLMHVTAVGPPPPATITVGNGTATTSYPYLTYWMDGRTQLLYTAAQIQAAGGSAGLITSMGFNLQSLSTQTMNGFNIRMMNTTATSITGYTSGMTTVYSGTWTNSALGWQSIPLQTPFIWDGSNLLIEVCYDNSSYTTYSYVYATAAAGQAIYYYTDNAAGCAFTSVYNGTNLPNLRFVEQPWVGTLTGTVLNCYNNAPLAGVTVTAGALTATTNASGSYIIYNVPIGNYNVQYSAPTFVTKTVPATITNGNTTTVSTCLDPIPAVLSGVITNAANGNPVVGAMVVATPGNVTTYSTAGGVYALNVFPAGNFTITVSKAGFDNFVVGPITLTQGNTTTQNFALLENTNPPVNVVGTLNTAATAVDLTWGLPLGNYMQIYDDGIAENFTVWAVAGNQNAVKFTPVGYPATVYGGSINIGTIDDYPSGSSPLVPFEVAVYDASGTGGTPGVALDTTTVTPANFGWVNFNLAAPITVTSGSFYLVMIQGGNAPNAAGVAVDETAPQLRSYARFVTGSGPWVPAGGNFMIRALINGSGGPLLLDATGNTITGGPIPAAIYQHQLATVTGNEGQGQIMPVPGDNGESITGYQVWRLKQGEEGTPGVWTSIGTPASTSMTDNGWPSLACGPYRWAVEAGYTGNRWSGPAFSNVIGKCWTAAVTINVGLTCEANPPEGSQVRLVNNNYPDTAYVGVTNTAGQVVFPLVWKGNYTLYVTRFTYPVYTQVIDIMGDMTIDVMLLQDRTAPTNLFVDDRSLESVWNSPKVAVPLLTETWASGSFATNQWVIAGGSNWQMSTGIGNPAPSAMFNWTPSVTNYSQTLTSKLMVGVHAPVMYVKYDIYLDNFGTTNENQMAVEAWDGTTWTALKTYTNMNGSISWTTDQVDLTAYTNGNFKIRFRAFGVDSYDINNWNVDNISIVATDGSTGLNPCVLGYNFYLNGIQDAFTTDTTYNIPPSHVAYGTLYHACVNAVYGSGYSSDNCFDFTAHFLYPPINLQAEAIECNAYLTWEQPVMSDAIDIPAFKGSIEHTAPDAGPAPKTTNENATKGIMSPISGTVAFGSDALADVIIDFDIANVSGYTNIAPNSAPDFLNGMAFMPNQPAWAYAVNYGGGSLWTVDRATGAMTSVGNMGSTSFNGMTVDPTTGILYATDGNNLFSIDPSVPSYTNIGAHVNANLMIGITCDVTGQLWAFDIGNDNFYSVDKTTGVATVVGPLGFNANYAQDMFYDKTANIVYLAAYNLSNSMTEIRQVDVTTGSSIIISSGSGIELGATALPILGGGGGVPPGLIGYNIYRDGDFIYYVNDPEILEYYDLNLDPDNYEYDVTAVYDLTDYGFPGMTDESLFEGPQFVSIECGRPLPFYEPWDQGSFAYNDWTFSPTQANWSVNTGTGNPAPSADFSWQPMITDYEASMESPILNAGPWNCASIWLDFDYSLVDRNATGDEKLAVDLFYNGSWHNKTEYANDGSVAWTPQHIEISTVKGKAFKVRFRANGANSSDILHWYVDNIHVYGVCNRPTDLAVEWTGPTQATLTWTAPVCGGGGGGGTVVQYIFDDGTFENGWGINPGYLAWLGTEFPLASTVEGVIQSVDVWFGFAAATGAILTVDFFDGTALTVNGSSAPFTAGSDDWVTVPVADVPFIGNFRAMVKWDNLSSGTNYLGLDEDGPYSAQDLEWYYDGTTWDKIWIAAGSGGPGVFGVRVTALVGGDLKQITLVPGGQPTGHITNASALTNHKGYYDSKNYTKMGVMDSPADSSQIIGYNVYRSDAGAAFVKLNGAVVPATTYVDNTVPATPSLTLDYFVTSVFNDSQANTFLCESPGSDTVSFVTSVNELKTGDLQIYPNPATEFVNVKSTSTINNIEVVNFLGQQVYTIKGVDAKTAKINVTSLKTGVYFVKVTTEQGIRTTKITVTK